MISSLIAEATECDFKSGVESDKPLSWLKSVSAFANGIGGTLFFGVGNDGETIGLVDAQADGEIISRRIKDRMTPIPEFILTPYSDNGKDILALEVKSGRVTPYYYSMEGSKKAYVRIGSESVPAPDHILNELILKGSNRTFDTIISEYLKADYSFTLLEATYRYRTKLRFTDEDYVSFGLATEDGFLTRAGALLTDQYVVYNSRLFCTRWDGLEMGSLDEDALDDKEYEGNLIHLLTSGCDFVKLHNKVRFVKKPMERVEKPDYAERAILEAMVNALIHRDWLMQGSEVHISIYDDRCEISSPGGMYSGKMIQDLDISKLKSERRNPVIADLFHRMRYMDRRGSGLKKIVNETKKLYGYTEEFRPDFYSTHSSFTVVLKNVNYSSRLKAKPDGDELAYDIDDEKKNGVKDGIKDGIKDGLNLSDGLNKTQTKILDLMAQNPLITIEQIANSIRINRRNTEKNISALRNTGLVVRDGAKKTGRWIVRK